VNVPFITAAGQNDQFAGNVDIGQIASPRGGGKRTHEAIIGSQLVLINDAHHGLAVYTRANGTRSYSRSSPRTTPDGPLIVISGPVDTP
jgi:hypothetical protein